MESSGFASALVPELDDGATTPAENQQVATRQQIRLPLDPDHTFDQSSIVLSDEEHAKALGIPLEQLLAYKQIQLLDSTLRSSMASKARPPVHTTSPTDDEASASFVTAKQPPDGAVAGDGTDLPVKVVVQRSNPDSSSLLSSVAPPPIQTSKTTKKVQSSSSQLKTSSSDPAASSQGGAGQVYAPKQVLQPLQLITEHTLSLEDNEDELSFDPQGNQAPISSKVPLPPKPTIPSSTGKGWADNWRPQGTQDHVARDYSSFLAAGGQSPDEDFQPHHPTHTERDHGRFGRPARGPDPYDRGQEQHRVQDEFPRQQWPHERMDRYLSNPTTHHPPGRYPQGPPPPGDHNYDQAFTPPWESTILASSSLQQRPTSNMLSLTSLEQPVLTSWDKIKVHSFVNQVSEYWLSQDAGFIRRTNLRVMIHHTIMIGAQPFMQEYWKHVDQTIREHTVDTTLVDAPSRSLDDIGLSKSMSRDTIVTFEAWERQLWACLVACSKGAGSKPLVPVTDALKHINKDVVWKAEKESYIDARLEFLTSFNICVERWSIKDTINKSDRVKRQVAIAMLDKLSPYPFKLYVKDRADQVDRLNVDTVFDIISSEQAALAFTFLKQGHEYALKGIQSGRSVDQQRRAFFATQLSSDSDSNYNRRDHRQYGYDRPSTPFKRSNSDWAPSPANSARSASHSPKDRRGRSDHRYHQNSRSRSRSWSRGRERTSFSSNPRPREVAFSTNVRRVGQHDASDSDTTHYDLSSAIKRVETKSPFKNNTGSPSPTHSTTSSRLSTSSRPQHDMSKVQCFYCKDYGHFISDCERRRRAERLHTRRPHTHRDRDGRSAHGDRSRERHQRTVSRVHHASETAREKSSPPSLRSGRDIRLVNHQNHADGTITVGTTDYDHLQATSQNIQFLFDTGADRSVISTSAAKRLLLGERGVTEIQLKRPLSFTSAEASSTKRPMIAKSKLLVDNLCVNFNDGSSSCWPGVTLYVLDNLRDNEVLIGKDTLLNIGFDIGSAIQAHCGLERASITAEPPNSIELSDESSDSDASSLVTEYIDEVLDDFDNALYYLPIDRYDSTDEFNETVWIEHHGNSTTPQLLSEYLNLQRIKRAKRKSSKSSLRSKSADDELDDEMMPPEVVQHDPDAVNTLIMNKVDELFKLKFDPHDVAWFRQQLLADDGKLLDVFRINTAPDPPTRHAPMEVNVIDPTFTFRAKNRHFSPTECLFLETVVDDLLSCDFIERVSSAQVVCQAFPVPKPSKPTDNIRKRFRLVVDLKPVNSNFVRMNFELPNLEQSAARIAQHKYLGKFDAKGGFWQIAHSPEAMKWFCFQTHHGLFRSKRMLHGYVNASGEWVARMNQTLDSVRKLLELYIDDGVVLSKEKRQLLLNWIEILKLLCRDGIKLEANKVEFCKEQLEWCGRVFENGTVRFNPTYLEKVSNMALPENAAQLREYIASANWVHRSIPKFSTMVQPLQAVLTQAIRLAGSSETKMLRRVQLADAGWSHLHVTAFRLLNTAIANSATMSAPTEGHSLIIATDASKLAWAAVLTQVPTTQLNFDVTDQDHRLIMCLSGTFTSAQSKWATIEQEGFAIISTVKKVPWLVKRPDGFTILTDNKDLTHLFKGQLDDIDFGRPISSQTSDRLLRWVVTLDALLFSIRHVKGVKNTFSDIQTRWANALLRRSVEQASLNVQCLLEVSAPKDLVNSVIRSLHGMQTRSKAKPRANSTQRPSVTPAAQKPKRGNPTRMPLALSDAKPRATSETSLAKSTTVDTFAIDVMTEFSIKDAPTLAELKSASSSWCPDHPEALEGLSLTFDGQLWRSSLNQIFVPDTQHLRLRICIVAHQSLSGHRGLATTLKYVQQHFTWFDMEKDITRFVRGCLACAKCRGAHTVPRQWVSTAKAAKPMQRLHMDFLTISGLSKGSRTKHKYVLVLKDEFSRLVMLTPCESADAVTAAEALLRWFSMFGPVPEWVSDQGTHFLNNLLHRMAVLLGVKHHFTAIYAPWSNGAVERANLEIVELLRLITLEAQLPSTDWPYVIPTVNMIMNNTPQTQLGNRAPIQVVTNRVPPRLVNLIVLPDERDVLDVDFSSAVEQHVSNLSTALDLTYADVVSHRRHAQRRHSIPIDFDIGDFVLVSSLSEERTPVDKTRPIWLGPARVVGVVNPQVFAVQELNSDRVREVHSTYLKRYADKEVTFTPQMMAFAAHGGTGWSVEALLDVRLDPVSKSTYQLLVQWENFDLEDATWESFDSLYRSSPRLVRSFVSRVQNPELRSHLLSQLDILTSKS